MHQFQLFCFLQNSKSITDSNGQDKKIVFHQNIDTLIQFLFSIMSVFIRIKVLDIQVQGGLNRIIFRKTVQSKHFWKNKTYFYKIGQKRNVWQSVSSVTFFSCENYCGLSKSASYIKLSDYRASYHRGLRQTIDVGAAITVWSLTHVLTFVYANALFGIITKCFLIWWTFGDTCHVIWN